MFRIEPCTDKHSRAEYEIGSFVLYEPNKVVNLVGKVFGYWGKDSIFTSDKDCGYVLEVDGQSKIVSFEDAKTMLSVHTPESLPVIFRKFREGEVIAFFPTLLDSFDPSECVSYMKIGQHSNADTSLISSLVKADEEEYKELLEEIKGIYEADGQYTLSVKTRSHSSYYNKRYEQYKRYRGLGL